MDCNSPYGLKARCDADVRPLSNRTRPLTIAIRMPARIIGNQAGFAQSK